MRQLYLHVPAWVWCAFAVSVMVSSCTLSAREDPGSADQPTRYNGPIIDMHLHASDSSNPMFGLTHPPTLRGETYEGATSAEDLFNKTLEQMSKHKIVKAMVQGGAAWKEKAPEGILVGHAYPLPVEQLKKLHEAGEMHAMAEMAPFYEPKLAGDPALKPYFDLAEELQVPVGFHIFPGGPNGGIYMMPEMLGNMRAANASPMQIEEILVAHPGMKVYLMHGGWPYIEDVKALMYMHPQLYVDVAVINWILPEKEFHSYLTALVDAGFGDRIMYGSDQMVWPQVIETGINSVNSAPLTDKQKENIFYNNAAEFLGLSEEERARHKKQ